MNDKPLTLFKVGACIVAAPLNVLQRRKLIRYPVNEAVFAAIYGFREAVQFCRFWRGAGDVPMALRPYAAIHSTSAPGIGAGALIDDADLLVYEPNVQADIMFEGWALNRAQVIHLITDPLRRLNPALVNPTSTWFNEGLLKGNEAQRAAAVEAISAALADRPEVDPLLTDILRGARFVATSYEEMRACICEVRDLMRLPMVLVACNHQYTPDGRGMAWPPQFKAQVARLAAELDIPYFDPAECLRGRDVRTLLEHNMMNYTEAGAELTAGPLLDFLRQSSRGSHP